VSGVRAHCGRGADDGCHGADVQKYGGTWSAARADPHVAKRVAHFHRAGHQLVVVPSAMSGETNRFARAARELAPNPRFLSSTSSRRRASNHRLAGDRLAATRVAGQELHWRRCRC
jgi:aspartokinase